MAEQSPCPPSPQPGHLPRLAPEFYRGFAVVHWVMTVDRRATGWLDALRHAQFREALLDTTVRYEMLCPTYCLMPDHAHFVWMGIAPTTDQRLAATFFAARRIACSHRKNGSWSPTTVCCARNSENAGRFNRCVTTCGKIQFAPDSQQRRTTTRILAQLSLGFRIWSLGAMIFGTSSGRSTMRRWGVSQPHRNRRGYEIRGGVNRRSQDLVAARVNVRGSTEAVARMQPHRNRCGYKIILVDAVSVFSFPIAASYGRATQPPSAHADGYASRLTLTYPATSPAPGRRRPSPERAPPRGRAPWRGASSRAASTDRRDRAASTGRNISARRHHCRLRPRDS